jgi:hypothetical protein
MACCEVHDLREPEPRYPLPPVCCPNGSTGEPDHLHIQTFGNQNLTVRACEHSTPECACRIEAGEIGWQGHMGQSEMWCSNEIGISEIIPITVPEPGVALGLVASILFLGCIQRLHAAFGGRGKHHDA